jgi:chromate transporter
VIAFVNGVTAAAIGAITGAVLVLVGRSIVVDIPTALVALAAMGLVWKVKKLLEPVIVVAAALIGIVAFPELHG